MEIYDQCPLCEQWSDLVKVCNTVFVCNGCANTVIEHAPSIWGKYKCTSEEMFMILKADLELAKHKKETSHGQASTSTNPDQQ